MKMEMLNFIKSYWISIELWIFGVLVFRCYRLHHRFTNVICLGLIYHYVGRVAMFAQSFFGRLMSSCIFFFFRFPSPGSGGGVTVMIFQATRKGATAWQWCIDRRWRQAVFAATVVFTFTFVVSEKKMYTRGWKAWKSLGIFTVEIMLSTVGEYYVGESGMRPFSRDKKSRKAKSLDWTLRSKKKNVLPVVSNFFFRPTLYNKSATFNYVLAARSRSWVKGKSGNFWLTHEEAGRGEKTRDPRRGHKSCQLERRPVVAGCGPTDRLCIAWWHLLFSSFSLSLSLSLSLYGGAVHARERTPTDKCLKGSPLASRCLSLICPGDSLRGNEGWIEQPRS